LVSGGTRIISGYSVVASKLPWPRITYFVIRLSVRFATAAVPRENP
jgi:hypothetical protein